MSGTIRGRAVLLFFLFFEIALLSTSGDIFVLLPSPSRGSNQMARCLLGLTLIGCPYPLINLVQSCDILACPYSDHCAVVVSVPIPEPIPRGPGRWKLNIPFLKDDNFRSSVSNFCAGWCCLVRLLRYWCYPFMPMTLLSSPHRKHAASTADAYALFEAGTCWGRQHQLVCLLLGVVSCRVFEVHVCNSVK